MSILTIFVELRSVCVADLFGVYGGNKGFTGLSGSTRNNMPFRLSYLFHCSGVFLLKVVTDCGILEETNIRTELLFKNVVSV